MTVWPRAFAPTPACTARDKSEQRLLRYIDQAMQTATRPVPATIVSKQDCQNHRARNIHHTIEKLACLDAAVPIWLWHSANINIPTSSALSSVLVLARQKAGTVSCSTQQQPLFICTTAPEQLSWFTPFVSMFQLNSMQDVCIFLHVLPNRHKCDLCADTQLCKDM